MIVKYSPRMLLLLGALIQALSLVTAQDFGVPPTWKNTTAFYTRSELVNLTQRAISRYIAEASPLTKISMDVTKLDASVTGLTFLSSIARKDYISGVKDNQDFVSTQLAQIDELELTQLGRMDLSIAHGMVAMDAYLAYGKNEHLNRAEFTYNDVSTNNIDEQDIKDGAHYDLKFNTTCYTGSLLGGVLDRPFIDKSHNAQGLSRTIITSRSTALWMTLLSRMASYVTDVPVQGYIDLALKNAQFLETMISSSHVQGCLVEKIDFGRPSCITGDEETPYECSTHIVEGLALLASVTKNATLKTLSTSQLSQILLSPRNARDGILTSDFLSGSSGPQTEFPDTSTSSKYYVMNWLYEPWRIASKENPQLAALIKTFTQVQVNSLIARARNPDNDMYAEDWTNQPATQFSVAGMSAAISALTAAIGPADETIDHSNSTASTTSAGSTLTSPSASDSVAAQTNKVPAGAIAGGVIGGLTALGAALFALWFYLRRRRQRKEHTSEQEKLDLDATWPPPALPYSNSPDHLAPPHAPGSESVASNTSAPALPPDVQRAPIPSDIGFSGSPMSAPTGQGYSKAAEIRAAMASAARSQASSSPASSAPSAPGSTVTASSVRGPSTIISMPEDVQQLIRRAEAAPGDSNSAALRQRLAELGPIPEVLQALQDMLVTQQDAEPQLPQYREHQ